MKLFLQTVICISLACLFCAGTLSALNVPAAASPETVKKINPFYAAVNDTASHGTGGQTGKYIQSITTHGRSRNFQAYVPTASGTPTNPCGLLVYMHGGAGDLNEGFDWCKWDLNADMENFILLCGNKDGSATTWKEVYDAGTIPAYTFFDTTYILDLVNWTCAKYNIDLSKIWISGFSDGASMAWRIGCYLSDIMCVACPQSGAWNTQWAPPTDCIRKIPVYFRVGALDDLKIPFNAKNGSLAYQAAGFEFIYEEIPGFPHQWEPGSNLIFIGFQKTRTLPHNWIRPEISFNKPAQGDKWQAGTSQTIEYYLGCGTPSYDITFELSTNGKSGPFTPIGSKTQPDYGTGTFNWRLKHSTPATTHAVLRAIITESSNAHKTNISVMNYEFEITAGGPVPPPAVTVNEPKAGDSWFVGDMINVNWSFTGGEGPYSIWANYSTDGGTTYKPIDGLQPFVQDLEGNGTAPWMIPNEPSANCIVKADVVGTGKGSGPSGGFSIVERPEHPVVTVSGPQAGSIWYVGDTYSINWTIAKGIAPFKVWVNFSTDGGSNFQAIASAQAMTQAGRGAGTFAWTVPPLADTSTCMIKVDAFGYGVGMGLSGTFSVINHAVPPVVAVIGPVAGSNFYAGATFNVTWNVSGGKAPYSIWLNYTADGGSSYHPLSLVQPVDQQSAGLQSESFTVPNNPSANCKVMVSVVGGGKAAATSGTFTIAINPQAPPAPTGLSATAGDATVTLTWNGVAGANSYCVYRSDISGTGYEYIDQTSTPSYTDSGLTNSKTYYYVVSAVKGSMESAKSSQASAMPKAGSNGGGGSGGGSGGSNTFLLAAVIGVVVVVVVIILIILLMMRKKKEKAKPAHSQFVDPRTLQQQYPPPAPYYPQQGSYPKQQPPQQPPAPPYGQYAPPQYGAPPPPPPP